MRRRLPNIPQNNQLSYKCLPNTIVQDIRYKLITPYLGGGTESYKNDEHTLIRVSSIRGVLRFWWRATRGGLSHGDARHLRRLEARIWGGNCREYTAEAKLCNTNATANGVYANGQFTHDNGYVVEWAGNGIINVQYAQNGTYIYHDVKLAEKGEHNNVLKNAQAVEIIRADFDNQSLTSLVVAVNNTQYELQCAQKEVMHPAKVKMHVVSSVSESNRISETSSGSSLLPGAGDIQINDVGSVLSYVLFPLRNVQNARITIGVEFTLHIEYPTAYQNDVEAALWAWEHFGGLGARTRRGLGAVERLDDKREPIVHNVPLATRLTNGLVHYVVAGTWPKHTPHISNVTVDNYGGATAASIFFNNKPPQLDARTAWGNLFETYRDFRQHRFLRGPNNRGEYKPHGENIWPEPNSLRQMERAPLRNVPPFATLGFQSHFPRAQMGMPVAHFFPGRERKFNPQINYDVTRTINIPDMHDSTKEGRFASPVLFRPVRDGNAYQGIVVILGGSRAPQIAKVIETKNQAPVYGTPTAGQTQGPELLNREGQPHGPTTTDDVLRGLFNFFH